MQDSTDEIVTRWAAVSPDLATTPLQVVLRIFRAARLLDQGVREHFAAHGLEPWEFDVLAALRRSDGAAQLRMSDLAGATMVSAGALTNRVDRLVAKGLVTRATDPDNRRMVRTTLTDAGRALVDELIGGHVANQGALIEELTAPEQEHLATLLRRLLLSLGDAPR